LTIEQIMNWNDIAEQCGTTSGAASKRYSRMKQAFEAGNAPPGSNPASPAPKTSSKATPKKKKTLTPAGESTPTPKRKRATPKKKTVEEEKDEDEKLGFKSKFEDSRNEDMHPSKKAKVAKPRATPDSKVTVKKETSMSVPTSNAIIFTKGEVEDNIEDTIEGRDGFVDPKEWVNELAGSSTIADDEDQDNRELSTRFL
jgi:hypothetical protein